MRGILAILTVAVLVAGCSASGTASPVPVDDFDLVAKFCEGWADRQEVLYDPEPEIGQMEQLREALRTLDYPQELRVHAQRVDASLGTFIDIVRTTPPRDLDAALTASENTPEAQAGHDSARVMRDYAHQHC